MLRTYQAQINIAATTDEVWKAIIQPEFTRDFLPEVNRSFAKLTLFKLAMHKNAYNVMPAYMVRNKTISWDTNANTSIELARKDLAATIHNIDINLRDKGNRTLVTIEVDYATKLNSTFLQIERTIRGLFKHKLDILKQDLESTKQERYQMQPAYN
jgi:carbon monoxide dehydrogenase subunit G